MTPVDHVQNDHAAANRTSRRSLVIRLISFLTLVDLFGAQALLPLLTIAYDVDAGAMGFAVNASTIGMAITGLAKECSPSEAATIMAAYITGNVASNLPGRLYAALAADTIVLSGSFFLFAALNICTTVLAYLSLSQTSPRWWAPAQSIWRIDLPGLTSPISPSKKARDQPCAC